MKPSEEETKEALQLLEEAHQRLLDTHNYGMANFAHPPKL
jgi:hypothetical protein